MPVRRVSVPSSEIEQVTHKKKGEKVRPSPRVSFSPKWSSSKKQKHGNIHDLKQELGQAHLRLDAVKDENQILHNQFQDATDINNKLLFDVTKSLETINNLSHSMQQCKSKLQKAIEDKKHLSEELAASIDRVMEISRESEDWRIKVIDTNNELQNTQREMALLREQNEQLKREREAMKKKLENPRQNFWSFLGRIGRQFATRRSEGSSSVVVGMRCGRRSTTAAQLHWQRCFCGLAEVA